MRLLRITITVVAVFAAAANAFYFAVLDTSFSTATAYTDVGLAAVPNESGTVVFVEKPNRMTLAMVRGEEESRLGFTDSGWRETVAIDMPRPSPGQRIDLRGSDVRIAYRHFQPLGTSQEIGERGVRGYLHVRSMDSDGLRVDYQITIDVHRERLAPPARNRDAIFEGRSTFRYQSRPTETRYWNLWPK
jgi:hypothetical protein